MVGKLFSNAGSKAKYLFSCLFVMATMASAGVAEMGEAAGTELEGVSTVIEGLLITIIGIAAVIAVGFLIKRSVSKV